MRVSRSRRTRRVRSQRGAIASLLLLVALQISCMFAVFSVDVAHQVSVQAELQSATDAAAIAGEEVLLGQMPSNAANAQAAVISIIKSNIADGKLIGNIPGVTITPNVQTDATGATPPTISVTISIPTFNTFAILIGRRTDKMTVTSVAGAGVVNTAFTPFPMAVVNRNYQANQTYTWYISDAPGLVPDLVTGLSAGLTGLSTGSSLPPYPGNTLGANTARFITTFNAGGQTGLLGAVTNLANGVGGPLGLGQVGTVAGGLLDPTVGVTGSTISDLLNGISSSSQGAPSSTLSMIDYWGTKVSSSPSSGYQLTTNTQPSANSGSFPVLPATPLAPPSLAVGQQVLLNTGSDSNTNNVLNTTAQYMQGASGNAPGSFSQSYNVMSSGLPAASTATQTGTAASWLQGQTIVIPVANPAPAASAITVPILDINLLGVQDSQTATYSGSGNGLLGAIVEPLTGIGNSTPIAGVIDKFIAVKVTGVTVQYQGSKGINLLGLNILNNPWAQQVVAITGVVQGSAATSGFGSSSHLASGQPGAYAAMLIQ